MRYRPFGKTGFEISVLGFGAMRLPRRQVGNESLVDETLSIAMIHRAFECGVNYIDTAYMYVDGASECIVGRAIKGWRDRIKLSTKLPLGQVKSRDDARRLLDEQLVKLDTDHIDFYHFHGLNQQHWESTVRPFRVLEAMGRALDEGVIKHLSFSFHDQPHVMRTFVDSGYFASVLCQYNLVDTANADSMAYAHDQGLGVVVMGPVGGGRLGSPHEYLTAAVDGKPRTPELALRFVLANPNVSCALSGMSAMAHVEENVMTAANGAPLSETETAQIGEVMQSRRELAKLYCTGCGYCMPCPHGVNIPACFECMINHKVYGFTDAALAQYRAIGRRQPHERHADACVGCGECEAKCPQKIAIRSQLAEVADTFGSRP